MKKVVTLMLVLGLVSVVSAVPSVVNLTLSTTDAHLLVAPGTVISVDFSIDQDVKIITETTGIDFTATGASNALAVGAWDAAGLGAVAVSDGTLDGTANAIQNAAANWTVTKLAGSILYSFDLTINEDGTVGMANLDGGSDFTVVGGFPPSYQDIGTVTGFDVTIIPEPATMALLGLGGLLLRRKK